MMTRRIFLKSSGLALVSFGAVPKAFLRTVYAAEGASLRAKTLVVVFQRGACDGLNTVVPYGDSHYHSLRPTIGIPAPRGGSRDGALDLDGFFGLHPALEPFIPLYKEGSLAPVHAVGSPDTTRSHFDAQDFMESGTPGVKSTEDGWMNRYLVSVPRTKGSPFRGVSVTPTLPRSLQGKAPSVALANIRDFAVRPAAGPAVAKGFEEMYSGAVRDVLHGTGQETFEAIDFLKKTDPARYTPAPGVQYPQGHFGESLKQIAQLVKADVGLEVAFTDVGGWDHHAGEGGVQGQLSQRLHELAHGISAFRADLGGAMDDVVLVTLTEFGRTARENGNRGTDHGHASVSFVVGGGVRGGKVQGRFPGLAPEKLYEGRDLALTTDFRDLVGEILVRHMGARDLTAVFPGYSVDPRRFPGVMKA
jgi:uncharacterized protein (DUF1501 family)